MADQTYTGPHKKADGSAIRIVMRNPDRDIALICTDYVQARAVQGIFEQGYFEIVAHIDSPICTTQHSGSSAMSQDWLEWSFDVYWRGYLMFSGPVSVVEIEHDGNHASARAKIYATTWFNWLLGSRMIETSSGGPFSMTTTAWDDIWKELIRTNCETGNVVAPPEYPGSASRDDFGSFAVTVSSDTGTSTTGDYRIQVGKPLLDSALELCNIPDNDADKLYPIVTETSPGTFNFSVEVGRSGGSRAIGSDKTGAVVISGWRGTVGAFKKRVEHNMMVSVAKCAGAGRGSSQRRRYVLDTGTKAAIGVREDGVTIPKGTTNAELDNEARRQLWEQKLENVKTFEFLPLEQEGAVYGTDFSIRDDITAYDIVTEETVTRMVVGAEASIVAPGPARLKLIFGKMPRTVSREAGRSGGGLRGGGRSGGGPPKDSEGDPESEPKAYRYVHTQGNTVDAEGLDHYLKIQGADTTTYIRARSDGTDTANSNVSGTPDIINLYVEGDPEELNVERNCIVRLRRAGGGNDIYLLAHDPDEGDGGGAP